MDLSFWGYGLVAVGLAVAVSSVELLTKYQDRTVREIFFSRYYLAFAFLNSLFCFLVYWSLPSLGALAIKSELVTSLQGPLVRAVTAGLGYLIIARTSILDINVRGETLGLGFDGIYNAIAQYLLRHHEKQLKKSTRIEFTKVYRSVTDAPAVFLGAARLLKADAQGEERQRIQDDLNLCLDGNPPGDMLCLSLYLLIRNYTAGSDEAEALILQKEEDLKGNPHQASLLKKELGWIYTNA
jgi:hypothetical protein